MPSEASKQFAALSDDLKAFHDYLKAERGMAENTVLAYGRDLDRFALWVADGDLADYLKPTVRALSNYLCFLRDLQLAPASIARADSNRFEGSGSRARSRAAASVLSALLTRAGSSRRSPLAWASRISWTLDPKTGYRPVSRWNSTTPAL